MPRVDVRDRWLLWVIACALVLGGIAALGVWWGRASTPATALQRAIEAYNRQAWEAAEKGAREHLRNNRDDRIALRLLARALYRQGRDQVATSISERLAEETLTAEDCFLRGEACARSGGSALAIAAWRNALELDPHWIEARVALEQLFLRSDRLNDAAREAGSLSAEPGWEARAALMLGRILTRQADPAGAAEAFARALAHPDQWHAMDDPDRVRKQLARCFLQTGRPARARALLALPAGAPDDPELGWLMSRCDLQQGTVTGPAATSQALSYRESHPMEPEPSPYVGEKRCADCHEPIYRDLHASQHARTYIRKEQFPAIPFPVRPVADPGNAKVTHSFHESADGVAAQTQVNGRVYQTIVDYAFGSGDRGMTPVGHDREGQFFEFRLSYYQEPVGWDVTSGHPVQPDLPAELYQGMRVTLDEVRRCMDCHNTHPHAILTGAGPESFDSAIGCERCHGPGGNHLTAVASKNADLAIARPSLASGPPIVALCGECHSPRTKDFRLSPGSPASIRFPGATLTWSRCYSESGNALDCITCHNPHKKAEPPTLWYETRCLQCHSAAGSAANRPPANRSTSQTTGPDRAGPTSCPVQPTFGCINCHMPKLETPVAHSRFTDHFIRAHRTPQMAVGADRAR